MQILVLGIVSWICAKFELRLWSGANSKQGAAVSVTGGDEVTIDEVKRLFVLENSIFVDMYYTFLDYKTHIDKGPIKYVDIMQLVRLYA